MGGTRRRLRGLLRPDQHAAASIRLLDDASVRGGTRVLDIASGPGFVAAMAAERGALVVGVDIAEAMVALARRLHPQLDFRRGNAEALPFGDESFDAVVANLLMLHLGRPERACTDFVRVLSRPRRPARAHGLGRSRSGALVRRDAGCAGGGGSGPARGHPGGAVVLPLLRRARVRAAAAAIRDSRTSRCGRSSSRIASPPPPRSGKAWSRARSGPPR